MILTQQSELSFVERSAQIDATAGSIVFTRSGWGDHPERVRIKILGRGEVSVLAADFSTVVETLGFKFGFTPMLEVESDE